MDKIIFKDRPRLGAAAAGFAVGRIKNAIKAKGQANITLATGASQFEVPEHLVAEKDIDWDGHLASNDPPADFDTEKPYIVVHLDEKCRMQQLGEGWFGKLDDVPTSAISVSIRQIMKSAALIVSVPDHRKAEAVRNALEGSVTPNCPASILQEHPNCTILLDEQSASLLSQADRGRAHL